MWLTLTVSSRPLSSAAFHNRAPPTGLRASGRTGSCACSAASFFDIGLATRLAGFCEASYCNPASDSIRAVDETSRLVEQRELPGGAGFFVARSPVAVYVAFRGTASVENIFSDLSVALVEMPWLAPQGGRARAGLPNTPPLRGHAGFVELYLSIRSLVLDATMRAAAEAPAQASAPAVCVTGHSLGGALATLFAADVAANLPQLQRRVCVYSFGSPRVGNEAFARAFNAIVPRSFRCRNKLDLVPRLPLWSPALRYKHVGHEVVFRRELEPAGRRSFFRRSFLLTRLGLRRRATSRVSAAREVELEPPRYNELTPKQLLDKFIAYPHLEQLDVQHHIHYLDSRFPKSPLGAPPGPVGLQAAHEALKVDLEALRVENRALVAENERLRCSNGEAGEEPQLQG